MPVGVLVNSLVIVIGGIIRSFAGRKLSPNFKENLNTGFWYMLKENQHELKRRWFFQ